MALGLIDLALILTSNHLPLRGAVAVLGLLVGWGWVSTGLFAWGRDPENRVGMLMAITGFAWLISLVGVSDIPLLFTLGTALGSLFFVTGVHMLMSAPDGRLHSTFERRLVAIAYALTLLVLPLYLFADPQSAFDCDDCPENVLLISANDTVVDVLGGVLDVAALTLVIVVMVYLVRRYQRAGSAERRIYGPLYLAGIALMIALVATVGVNAAATSSDAANVAWLSAMAVLGLMPFAFLAALRAGAHVAGRRGRGADLAAGGGSSPGRASRRARRRARRTPRSSSSTGCRRARASSTRQGGRSRCRSTAPAAPWRRSSATARRSRRSSTTPRSRAPATTSGRSARLRRSRSRTSGSTPSCAPSSRSCVRRASAC